MSTILLVSARIYSGILSLYPVELRREFGGEEIVVPLIVYVLSGIYLSVVLLRARQPGPMPIGQVIGGSLLFGLLPALTAFVALRVGNHDVPIPLVPGLNSA